MFCDCPNDKPNIPHVTPISFPHRRRTIANVVGTPHCPPYLDGRQNPGCLLELEVTSHISPGLKSPAMNSSTKKPLHHEMVRMSSSSPSRTLTVRLCGVFFLGGGAEVMVGQAYEPSTEEAKAISHV